MPFRRRNRLRRRGGAIFAVATALAIVVTAIVILITLTGDKALGFPSGAEITYFSGRLLNVSGGVAGVYSTSGKLKKTVDTPGADAISAGKSVAAIYGSGSVYILSKSFDVAFSVTSGGDIESVSCEGSIVTVLQRTGSGAEISVFDPYGNKLFALSRKNSDGGVVTRAGQSGGLLYVSSLDSSGAETASKTDVYNIYTGELYSGTTVFGDVTRELLFAEKVFFAIGNERIICYNHNGVKLTENSISGMSLIYDGLFRGNAVILMKRNDGSGARVIVGEEKHDVAFDIKSAVKLGGKLALLTEGSDVVLYDLSSGRSSAVGISGVDALVPCGRSLVARIDGVWTRIKF